MEIQLNIRKLHVLIRNLLFKKNPLLMLTDHIKALFIFLANPNKVLCIKIKQPNKQEILQQY